LLSRRATLKLLGAAGATAVVGFSGPRLRLLPAGKTSSVASAQTLSCVVRPQLTEGPYFVDERLNRSDIRTDPTTNEVKPGALLVLTFNVNRVTGNLCSALPGAYLDIWHCDALGSYSDVRDGGFDTRGQKYLRGYQITDPSGSVRFQTIYPGWYSGRTVHIHFKIRLFTGTEESYEFTSQLFFDDAFTDQVYTQGPYNSRGTRNTRNTQDGIFNGGGSQLILDISQTTQGYAAAFNIGLEGVPSTDESSAAPFITGASISSKRLLVTGQNFDNGAKIYLNGERQKKTENDETNPANLLIARKSGNLINAGETVMLQVRNADNTFSNQYSFTRSE